MNVVAEIFKFTYILHHDNNVHNPQHHTNVYPALCTIQPYAQSSMDDAHISSICFWNSPRGIISECINSLRPSDVYIYVGKITTISSDNGLLPDWRQAIIWTNAGILLIGPLGTNFNEILLEIYTFSFTKMHLKMSSWKWRPFVSASMCKQYFCGFMLTTN